MKKKRKINPLIKIVFIISGVMAIIGLIVIAII